LATSGGIEQVAGLFAPDSLTASSSGLSGRILWAWLWQTFAVAAMQAGACFLRNYGESLFRDLVVWLWDRAVLAAWATLIELFSAWVPVSWFHWLRGRRAPRRRPVDRPEDPSPQPPAPTWRERWRQRRQVRRERG
jgi:hypothetical protein